MPTTSLRILNDVDESSLIIFNCLVQDSRVGYVGTGRASAARKTSIGTTSAQRDLLRAETPDAGPPREGTRSNPQAPAA